MKRTRRVKERTDSGKNPKRNAVNRTPAVELYGTYRRKERCVMF